MNTLDLLADHAKLRVREKQEQRPLVLIREKALALPSVTSPLKKRCGVPGSPLSANAKRLPPPKG